MDKTSRCCRKIIGPSMLKSANRSNPVFTMSSNLKRGWVFLSFSSLWEKPRSSCHFNCVKRLKKWNVSNDITVFSHWIHFHSIERFKGLFKNILTRPRWSFLKDSDDWYKSIQLKWQQLQEKNKHRSLLEFCCYRDDWGRYYFAPWYFEFLYKWRNGLVIWSRRAEHEVLEKHMFSSSVVGNVVYARRKETKTEGRQKS